MEFKIGDVVKINKKATIDDFTKEHWGGCQNDTLKFIREHANENKTFIVEDVMSTSKNIIIGDLIINKNIFLLVGRQPKEMTITEIEKELGYSIKIVK